MTTNKKSVSRDADEIILAKDMIMLGARLQVVESETALSRERLAKLYRELQGCAAPKGMLPFSVDWYMTWMPNIHSSMFYSIYRFLARETRLEGVRLTVQAYRLYRNQVACQTQGNGNPTLSFTRAWMLVRFFESKMLQLSACTQCDGEFVAHAHAIRHNYVCAICRPPPRAGKKRRPSTPKSPSSSTPASFPTSTAPPSLAATSLTGTGLVAADEASGDTAPAQDPGEPNPYIS